MFSFYKNRPTFKVLVGCDETATVNFISDVFGGSIPPFLERKKLRRTQFNEDEVLKTRAIANRRKIIEQVNGGAKKNR